MDTSNLKNIVVLKDLPSNIVEEAIVFLKENQKLKKPELIDMDVKPKKGNAAEKGKNTKEVNSKQYIVSEAQMLIADYISKLENKNRKEDISYKKLKNKYQLLKKISGALAIAFIISIFLLFTV